MDDALAQQSYFKHKYFVKFVLILVVMDDALALFSSLRVYAGKWAS